MSKWVCSVIFLLVAGCTYNVQPLQPLSDKFYDIQQRTLNKSCAYSGCHYGDYSDINFPKAYLALQPDSAYNQLLYNHKIQDHTVAQQFKALVVPGDPDGSYLVYKLKLSASSSLYGDPMPSRQGALPQNEIDAIVSWIKRGAPCDTAK